jgi:hypothetical protein
VTLTYTLEMVTNWLRAAYDMATDSELQALADKLKQPHQLPLDDEELKWIRRVIKVLEAFAVMGGLGKGLLVVIASLAALVIYGRDILAFIRGGPIL